MYSSLSITQPAAAYVNETFEIEVTAYDEKGKKIATGVGSSVHVKLIPWLNAFNVRIVDQVVQNPDMKKGSGLLSPTTIALSAGSKKVSVKYSKPEEIWIQAVDINSEIQGISLSSTNLSYRPYPLIDFDGTYDFLLTDNDIQLTHNGGVKLVTREKKLKQDLEKIVLTEINSNKYHSNYGSELMSVVGEPLPPDIMETEVFHSINTAVENLILLQEEQSKQQLLDPTERIDSVENISVERDKIDPRKYYVFVEVITASQEKLTTSFLLGV